MSSSLPLQIAETIQTASINRAPSPTHDLNPSTASSQKIPVKFAHNDTSASTSSPTLSKYGYDSEHSHIPVLSELEEGIDIDLDDEDEDEDGDVPYEKLERVPRRGSFPPLPDLRFEQSYLASISGAETGWAVAYITIRDQIFFPLLQGTIWSLALHGWRFWNRSAQLNGSSAGAKVRRWWYKTNNWKLPEGVKNWGKNESLARSMGDFYENQNSAD